MRRAGAARPGTPGRPHASPGGLRRRAVAGALAALLAAASGCGADEPAGTPPPRASAIVDPSRERPWVTALDVLPGSGDLLLATNRGLFRVGADGTARRQAGRVRVREASSPVGTFLFLRVAGPQTLLGSGHPDDERALPPYLGLIRSDDGGRTWSPVSRLGEADLHQIRVAGPLVYAFDAATSTMLRSEDGGRSWRDSNVPEPVLVDFAVDPADRDVLVASGEEDGLFRSQDGGRTWRPVGDAAGARLAWPAPDRLVRADRDGRLHASPDRGRTWRLTGRVAGEPAALATGRRGELLVALVDGTVLASPDGGRTFAPRFTPPR